MRAYGHIRFRTLYERNRGPESTCTAKSGRNPVHLQGLGPRLATPKGARTGADAAGDNRALARLDVMSRRDTALPGNAGLSMAQSSAKPACHARGCCCGCVHTRSTRSHSSLGSSCAGQSQRQPRLIRNDHPRTALTTRRMLTWAILQEMASLLLDGMHAGRALCSSHPTCHDQATTLPSFDAMADAGAVCGSGTGRMRVDHRRRRSLRGSVIAKLDLNLLAGGLIVCPRRNLGGAKLELDLGTLVLVAVDSGGANLAGRVVGGKVDRSEWG